MTTRIRTKGDGIRAAKAAVASYQKQRSELEAEQHRVRDDLASVQHQLDTTLDGLATGLLRSTESDAIEAAANETGAMHLFSVLEKLQTELDQAKARVAHIETMEDYIQREELTHPTTGDYSVKIEEQRNLVDDVTRTLAPFKMSEFQWLYKRGVHEQTESSAFGKFWRAVTLADRREAAATTKVLARLKYETFTQCADIYDDQRKVLRQAKKNLSMWEARREDVLGLVTEHDELEVWVEDFATSSLTALRQELAQHLVGCDYKEIHRGVRPAGKVLVAKADALTEKLEYLSNLSDFLRKEISDRDQRIASIERVQRKWSHKPYGLMRGNKHKWLVQVPEMKRQSTTKRVHWCSTMRSNVYHYDDYGHYDGFLEAGVVFLAYDAFNFGADVRPPYEGFSREVVPALDEFRDEHGMERADYSDLRGVETAEYSEDWDQSAVEAEEMAAAALAESEAEATFVDES